MSSPTTSDADQIRRKMLDLASVVREMSPGGAKKTYPIPPVRFNLLARPSSGSCRICNLPGHRSETVKDSAACRTALLSLIHFWEDQTERIRYLYSSSERFNKAVKGINPTYEMRLDNAPKIAGDMEVVIVDGLTRNYLKFQAHIRWTLAKVKAILSETDMAHYEGVSKAMNDFLLGGQTLQELYEHSVITDQE